MNLIRSHGKKPVTSITTIRVTMATRARPEISGRPVHRSFSGPKKIRR